MAIDGELVGYFRDEALDLLSRWETVCLSLSKQDTRPLLEELFRVAHNLKGSSAVAGLEKFATFVHRIEDGIVLLRDGQVPAITDNIVSVLLEAQKRLTDWIVATKENAEVEFDYREFLERYQGALRSAGMPQSAPDARTAQGPADVPVVEPARGKRAQTASATIQDPAPKAATGASSSAAGETVRISAQKLDQLLQTIGELSIHQSIIWHMKGEIRSANKLFLNSAQLAQKLTKEIYDRALSLRMQPLTQTFQRLERAIVELAPQLGKDVQVVVTGSEVELDKAVVERILDPLTHIVRNAIDHGVETKEARVAAGKQSQGTIEIIARQDTFGVELIIRDDGKGLNAEKIRNKAVEKGLINPSREYTKEEILDFIFLPGFSTVEKVTDVSGRGVGMDVVRRTLEVLRGSIEIDSQEGAGTRFVIRLPTSVSIIDVLLIRLAGNSYVVPIDAVDEVITLEDGSRHLGEKMMIHNGRVLPLADLQQLLARGSGRIAAGGQNDEKSRNAVLVCKYGQKKVGLLFDRVIGQQQVVVRSFSDNIGGAFGLLGGTILGNGEPGLIIDMNTLVNQYAKDTGTSQEASA